MKKVLVLIISIFLFPIMAYADDITSTSAITVDGQDVSKLVDKNDNTYIITSSSIEVSSNETIKGIYIIYELNSVQGNISYGNKSKKIGENSFLHEYVDLKDSESKNISINYDSEVKIGEIYVLSEGSLPDYIEVWDKPYDKADLLLFSSHSDDEQLFFLGLLPTYVARGAYVQVVYFTNHNDNPRRLHEQLHGLYKVGIRSYPIIGFVPDAWSESLEEAISNLEKSNYTEKDALDFEIEMIRRFKPQVVVGHDENGEYSHGQHILNTYLLKQAVEKANDKEYILNNNEYTTWDTPKTYLHLYSENKIVMNYDEPLDYFDGKTAYEVSKLGYKEHESQQWTWFTDWINGKNNEYTKATDIVKYSPCEFGLYRSTVGEDVEKNDMFENLEFYKDQNILETTKKQVKETIKKVANKATNNKYYTYIIAGIVTLIIIRIIFKKRS